MSRSAKSQRPSASGDVDVAKSMGAPPCALADRYQPNELLTIAEVCKEYGIGRTTLYAALGEGSLPAKVLGKRGTRIRREDMDAWIKALSAYRPAGSKGRP